MVPPSFCPVDLSAKSTYFNAIPHELLTRLRHESPVFWHQNDANRGYWAVLRHEDIRTVSRDNKVFSSNRKGVFYEDQQDALAGSLILLDPPEHGKARAVFDNFFGKDAVKTLEDFLRDKCRQIIAGAATLGTCDFVYDLAAELPLAAISQIMDVPMNDRNELLNLGDAVIRAATPGLRNEALSELGGFGHRLAGSRPLSDGATDLVSAIRLSEKDGRRISNAEFGAQFAQIAVAANETTRTLISNIALEFIQRPHLLDQISAEPEIIPQAIEEFLRWVTPIYYMRRTATTETMLGGQVIQEGDPVVMYYLSGNRDEDVFENPFEIDLKRSPNRHLSFGLGRHVCLGQFLARLETRIFLEEFAARFVRVTSAGKPERLLSNITNSWERIPVTLHSR